MSENILIDLLNCKPTLVVQLTELVILTCFMFPFLKFMTWSVVYPLMRSLSPEVQHRFSFYSIQSLKNSFFITLSLEEGFLVGCILWAVLFAHLIGGALCVPSVYGRDSDYFSVEFACTLARHGALSEAAWELQDVLKRGYQVLFLDRDDVHTSPDAMAHTKLSRSTSNSFKMAKQLGVLFSAKRKFKGAVNAVIMTKRLQKIVGTKKDENSSEVDGKLDLATGEKGGSVDEPRVNPVPLLIILAIHHSIGQLMIVPMNMFYPDNELYHEMVFLLLFAAFVCMSLGQLSYMVDCSTFSGLVLMNVLTLISWVVVVYSRVVRYGAVIYALFMQLYNDEAFVMMGFGSVGVLMMSVFNALLFVDATGKLFKFSKKLVVVMVNGAEKKNKEKKKGE